MRLNWRLTRPSTVDEKLDKFPNESRNMQFVNCTPHEIVVHCHPAGEAVSLRVFATSGIVPRLDVSRKVLPSLDGIPMVRSVMGSPTGLPNETEGVTLIVSALVAEHPHVRDRTDICYPGEAVRSPDGMVVGCRGLCASYGMAAGK